MTDKKAGKKSEKAVVRETAESMGQKQREIAV